MKNYLLYITLLTLGLPILHGQDYLANVQHYAINQGMSHREVFAIHEDEQGFIWVGTKYGLNRFDGLKFRWFTKEKDGLASNTIHHIRADGLGNLWLFETNSWYHLDYINAISIFNLATEKVTQLEEKDFPVPWIQIQNCLAVQGGGFYFGTADGLLLKYHPKTGFKKIPIKDIKEFYLQIWSKTNTLWGFNEKNDLVELDTFGNVLNLLSNQDPASIERKEVLQQDENGRLWISTFEQIDIQTRGKKQLLCTNDLSEENPVVYHEIWTHYSSDPFNKVVAQEGTDLFWFKGKPDLLVLDEKGQEIFDFSKAYPDIAPSDIRCIYFDRANRTWLGTFYGLFLIDLYKSPFQRYLYLPPEENQAANFYSCRGILEENENIWITSYNGVAQFNKYQKTPQFLPQIPYTNPAYNVEHTYYLFPHALYDDKKGNIWFGDLGLARLRKEDFSTAIFPENPIYEKSHAPGSVWSIYEDPDGKFWVGTYNGVGYLDTLAKDIKGYIAVPPFEALHQAQVNAFVTAPNGLVYLTTTNGLYEFHYKQGIKARYWSGGTGQYYLPVDDIRHLHIDKKGDFWLATFGGGLIQFRPDSTGYRQFTISEGLSNNNLYAIYEDKNDNLWASSDYGIIQFNKISHFTRAFLPEDGTTHSEFNTISHFQAEDGHIYFGSLNGVTAFYPDELLKIKEEFSAPLVVTGFQQFDKETNNILDKTLELNQSKKITLQPGEVFFDLQFALLHYIVPEQIRYAYQLNPVGQTNAEWIYLQGNNIRFGGLAYGDYQLNVRAQGPDGRFSSEQLHLEVAVIAPIYLQRWFLAIMSLLLVGGIYFIYQQRTRGLRKRQKELQKIVEERTQTIQKQNNELQHDKALIEQQAEELRHIDQLKSNFFANVSHELRTPLNLILGPIHAVLKRNQLKNKDFTLLTMAKNSGKDLLRLVNEILDIAKLEQSKIELVEQPVVFYPLLRRIVAGFESYAAVNDLHFELKYLPDRYLKIKLDISKFEKILNNLLSNAFKFTPSRRNGIKGSVRVTVVEEAHQLQISVQDTGRGIHPDDLPHIFNRFYQSKRPNVATEGGTGIGLALSQELSKLMKGKLWVESEWQQGSTFYFSFPKIEIFGEVEALEELSPIAPLVLPLEPMASSDTSTKANILLVEDNHNLRSFIQMLLADHYHIITAENGRVALQKLPTAHCQLIISDVMMPEMDGFQLLEQLKSNEQYRSLPILMLTARADMQDKLHALRLGVDDYMTKPFVQEELLARIENLLHNAAERHKWVEEAEPELETASDETEVFSVEDNRWLESVETEVLQQLPHFDFNTQALAETVALSRSQLFRRLKKLTGLTPSQYIKEARLKQARTLLETRQCDSVKAAAYSVGWKHLSSFSGQFKARFGKLPSAYF